MASEKVPRVNDGDDTTVDEDAAGGAMVALPTAKPSGQRPATVATAPKKAATAPAAPATPAEDKPIVPFRNPFFDARCKAICHWCKGGLGQPANRVCQRCGMRWCSGTSAKVHGQVFSVQCRQDSTTEHDERCALLREDNMIRWVEKLLCPPERRLNPQTKKVQIVGQLYPAMTAAICIAHRVHTGYPSLTKEVSAEVGKLGGPKTPAKLREEMDVWRITGLPKLTATDLTAIARQPPPEMTTYNTSVAHWLLSAMLSDLSNTNETNVLLWFFYAVFFSLVAEMRLQYMEGGPLDDDPNSHWAPPVDTKEEDAGADKENPVPKAPAAPPPPLTNLQKQIQACIGLSVPGTYPGEVVYRPVTTPCLISSLVKQDMGLDTLNIAYLIRISYMPSREEAATELSLKSQDLVSQSILVRLIRTVPLRETETTHVAMQVFQSHDYMYSLHEWLNKFRDQEFILKREQDEGSTFERTDFHTCVRVAREETKAVLDYGNVFRKRVTGAENILSFFHLMEDLIDPANRGTVDLQKAYAKVVGVHLPQTLHAFQLYYARVNFLM